MEKEKKLIEIMKMNGLKIIFYWNINFLFNFTIYLIILLIFFTFGFFALQISFFTQINIIILALVFISWGLC